MLRKCFYKAVMPKKRGDKLIPVPYYSKKLSPVVRGVPPCARAVAVAAAAVTASSPLVAYRPLLFCLYMLWLLLSIMVASTLHD